MSNYAEPPKTIKFPQWSWLGSDDTSSGVMAVQRETFGNYLVGILNAGFDLLSAKTDGKATYKDEAFNCTAKFVFEYTCPPAYPAVWEYIPTDQTLASASYNYSSGNSYNYGPNCSICGSVSCHWDYMLTSTL
jgi:hypothetical protein